MLLIKKFNGSGFIHRGTLKEENLPAGRMDLWKRAFQKSERRETGSISGTVRKKKRTFEKGSEHNKTRIRVNRRFSPVVRKKRRETATKWNPSYFSTLPCLLRQQRKEGLRDRQANQIS